MKSSGSSGRARIGIGAAKTLSTLFADSPEGNAIEREITARHGLDRDLSLVDLGSNHGYICLRAAMRYRAALAIGVEGSVGHGNGSVGTSYSGQATKCRNDPSQHKQA